MEMENIIEKALNIKINEEEYIFKLLSNKESNLIILVEPSDIS